MTTLDPRDARPLTNREISKVLCSIIGGITTAYPAARERVPHVLKAARGAIPRVGFPDLSGNWETALLATVSGFRGWCAPGDVDSAVEWVDRNLQTILDQLENRMAPS